MSRKSDTKTENIYSYDVNCFSCGSICRMKSMCTPASSGFPSYTHYDCDCGYIRIAEGSMRFERLPGKEGVLWVTGHKCDTIEYLTDTRTMKIIETGRITI